MGRNAKPIHLQLLEGNKPHMSNSEIDKRKEAEESLQFRDDQIVPPSWLKGKELLELFNNMVKEFEGLGLLKNVDVIALALLTDALYDYIRFTRIINREGYMIEQTNKANATNKVPHPLLTKKNAAFTQINKLMGDFGLTPVARARLAMNLVNEENEEEEDNKFKGRV